MAFEDTFATRTQKLLTNPKENIKNIIPFIKSRVLPYYRSFLETIRVYHLSKPYCGHDELLQFIKEKDGFFVECGGNDGYGNDPTYYLEKKFGWTGLIVEPLPIHKLCKNNRRRSKVYNCAVSSFSNTKPTITLIDCNAMSFIEGSIENSTDWIEAGERTQKIKAKHITVSVFPVQKLIDEYFELLTKRKIDLFVADVEGHELDVLKGLDFTKNSPSLVLLEIHTEEKLVEITSYLEERSYVLMKEIGHHDYIFKLTPKSELI